MENRKNPINKATFFIISGLLGPFIVLPFIIFLKWDIWSTLIKSFFVASINGITCYATGTLLYRFPKLKIFGHLTIELLITVIISGTGAFLLGCVDPLALTLMIIFAGFICVFLTIFMHRYKTRLDQKLCLAQERLRQRRQNQ